MKIIAIQNHEKISPYHKTTTVGVNIDHIVEIRDTDDRDYLAEDISVEIVCITGSIFHVHGTVSGWIKKLNKLSISDEKDVKNEKISSMGSQG